MSSARRLAPHRAALVGALGLLAAAADWPQFLGPQRNGASAETGLLQAWPPQGPPVLWEKAVGAGLSGPVVAGSRLILCHRRDDRELVTCFDPATGTERWQFA